MSEDRVMDNSRFKFRAWGVHGLDGNMTTPSMYYFSFTEGLIPKVGEPHAMIMQCTGLKDKNGKLIYESDLIKFGQSGDTQAVIWDTPAFRLENEDTDLSWWAEHGHVVGNIYEHSELLEVKDDK